MLGLVLMQVAGPVLPAPRPVDPTPCPPATTGEVVVCARPGAQEQYRLRPLDPRYVETPRDAVTIRLPGGGAVAPDTQQGRLGEPQIMLRLKLPL